MRCRNSRKVDRLDGIEEFGSVEGPDYTTCKESAKGVSSYGESSDFLAPCFFNQSYPLPDLGTGGINPYVCQPCYQHVRRKRVGGVCWSNIPLQRGVLLPSQSRRKYISLGYSRQ